MRLIRVLLTWLALRTILGLSLVLVVAYSVLPDRPDRRAFDDLRQRLERLPSTLTEIGRALRSPS